MKYSALLILFALLTGCFDRVPEKTGLEGKPLPTFNILLMDSSTRLSTATIPPGKPIVLFLFTPSCPYCRAQTEEIIANMQSFKDVRFYIFTMYPFPQIKRYYDHFSLKNYPNIIVGQDYDSSFVHYFKPSSVPYMAIYTRDKHLREVLRGKVDINEIKDVVFK